MAWSPNLVGTISIHHRDRSRLDATLLYRQMTGLEQLLEPALGYLHLGMLTEATDEIAALPPALQESKEALRIRALIHKGRRKNAKSWRTEAWHSCGTRPDRGVGRLL
jgi:hypothetical protein